MASHSVLRGAGRNAGISRHACQRRVTVQIGAEYSEPPAGFGYPWFGRWLSIICHGDRSCLAYSRPQGDRATDGSDLVGRALQDQTERCLI